MPKHKSSSSSSRSHANIVYLTNKDFKYGTYRIRNPGLYVLNEDIVFEPNRKYDWMPRPEQVEYQDRAYHMGFFAAITIECKDVEIDLNGHSLEQSKVHALQQRFYANIELTNTPFIRGQGPGNFGQLSGSAHNCIIKNGIIGRSSHHGIHGNKVKHVRLENLTIKDFEVAGAAINGFYDVKIENCEIGRNRRDVPVNSQYSAARFTHIMGSKWLAEHGEKLDPKLEAKYRESLQLLRKEMDVILDYVRKDERVPEDHLFAMKAHREYEDDDGELLPDGNNYGLLFHVPGIAVLDFIEEDTKENLSKNLSLRHVRVRGIRAKVTEVVGLSQGPGKVGAQNDVSGSVFRIQDVVSETLDGRPTELATYVGNVLTSAQLTTAEASLAIDEPIGRSSISQDLIDWAKGGKPFKFLYGKGYDLICNGDSMLHVQKGVHGIRTDGLDGGNFYDVKVEKISNVGHMGSLACGRYEKSHPAQKRPGYCGADVSGISFSYTNRVNGDRVKVRTLHSDNSTCRGFRFINECQDVRFNRTKISEVSTGYEYSDGCWYGINSEGQKVLFTSCLPDLVPLTFGVCIEGYGDHMSSNIRFPDVKIDDISGVANCNLDYAWQTIRGESKKEESKKSESDEEEECLFELAERTKQTERAERTNQAKQGRRDDKDHCKRKEKHDFWPSHEEYSSSKSSECESDFDWSSEDSSFGNKCECDGDYRSKNCKCGSECRCNGDRPSKDCRC